MKNIYCILGVLVILSLCCVSNAVGEDDTQLVAPKIDLVFVIDTTGSMYDEIREVKMHIKNMIEEVLEGSPRPDVSIGFVIYRDYPDQEREYLYKIYPMTTDIDTVMENLEEIQAAGGGDYEEAVTLGLHMAINNMDWRVSNGDGSEDDIIGYDQYQNPIYASGTPIKKMMVLIGDAPPRTFDYLSTEVSVAPLPTYKENIEDAKDKNIVIYTVSGSGMNDVGIEIWKEIAEETGGEYEHLTYERRDVQDYIIEKELDEEWVESVKEYSDYDRSDNTIMTNSLGDFVKEAVVQNAEAMGVRYDGQESNLQYVSNIGYLVDSDGDETLDTFHNYETRELTDVKLEADNYLIDYDGDSKWDFVYNNAGGLSSYQEQSLPGFELLFMIMGIVVSILIMKKYRKSYCFLSK